VWFYTLGHRLEIDRIAGMARQFGLGSATGIDLPRESRRRDGSVGTVPDRAWKQRRYHERWWPGDTISCSIGQGYIEASPLQMALMSAAVANCGEVYRPRLVTEILDSAGRPIKIVDPVPQRRVNAPAKYFALVQQGMRLAVTNGTGKVCDIPGVVVAGKTGSAETRGPAHGWFICFAPMDKPRIAIACIVEHGRHGATTAAPVCRAMLDVYFGKKKPQEVKSGQTSVRGD
jgi:penicillin-binding protein 2